VVPGSPQRRPAAPRAVLPLTAVPAARPINAAVYGMAAIDDRGRIADQLVVRALRWDPGTCIGVDVDGGVAMLTARPDGVGRVAHTGRVRLPASVRHQLRLGPGDRVLLVARPAAAQLIAYPPAALDAILASTWPSSPGGPA
jgi:hypothetical protein